MLMDNFWQKNDFRQVTYASSDDLSSYTASLPRQDLSIKMAQLFHYPIQSYPVIPHQKWQSPQKNKPSKLSFNQNFMNLPRRKYNDFKNKSIYASSSQNLGILNFYALKLCNFINSSPDNS